MSWLLRVSPLLLLTALSGCASRPAPRAVTGTFTRQRPTLRPAYLLLQYAAVQRVGQPKVARPLSPDDPRQAELIKLLDRPFNRWVLRLGQLSRKAALRRCAKGDTACVAQYDHPALLVVVNGGNRPKRGLTLCRKGRAVSLPKTWYAEIDSRGAEVLFPHEYGHALMFQNMPPALMEGPPLHPRLLPHTTGAMTNDLVAFTEGWGIHFETLAGQRSESVATRAMAQRDNFLVTTAPDRGDSLLPARDLLSYAQSYRRHTCIKENCFAYLPRVPASLARQTPPTNVALLSRWTDTTGDPARVRTLEQMVASEGVVAALFYRLATVPDADLPANLGPYPLLLAGHRRYLAFFKAFAQISPQRLRSAPAVLVFLQALLQDASPVERRRIARVALEVLHYTPLLKDAPAIYARLHAAGRQVELKRAKGLLAAAGERMARAVDRLAREPFALADTAAPELWLVNKQRKLDLPLLGLRGVPLALDLNTAPPVFWMTLPGVDLTRALAIDDERRQRGGFSSLEDFVRRGQPAPATVTAVKAMLWRP